MTDIKQKALALVNEVQLRELFDYDPASGVLTWRKRGEHWFKSQRDCQAWNTRYAGKPANYIHKLGYVVVRLFGRAYKGHRVAYAIHYGRWPTLQIDHINGVKTDNRIANLREVDNQTNARNTKIHRHNTSGFSGIYWHKRDRKWIARIGTTKAGSFIGAFKNLDDAIAARKAAEKQYGFHPNHGRAAIEARGGRIVWEGE